EALTRVSEENDDSVPNPKLDERRRAGRAMFFVCLTSDHGTGTRYRLRCTLSRVNAYISAVGPGTTLPKGMTRAPGSFKISCSDGSPWTIRSGTIWPGDNGNT